MHKRIMHLAGLFAACVMLASFTVAAPTPSYAADPTSTPAPSAPDYGKYTVLSTTELDLGAGPVSRHAHISPDGTLFAYGDAKQLCIYTIAGDMQTCSDLIVNELPVRLDNDSVVWSPDSSKLAFTSDFLLTFRNPGTWVMDAKTGKIIKTTGIGFERASILKDDNLVVDLAPKWLPDSQHMVFLRYYQIKGKRTGPFVNVLDVPSGNIKEYENLVSESISIYLTGISSDGTLLAFNNDGRGSKIEGGLWLYNLNKNTFKKLYGISKTEETPRVMSFSADSEQILISNYTDGTADPTFKPEDSPIRLVDVATGKLLLVDSEKYVRRAGWAPTGKAIAYIVYNAITPDINGLYIATEPGKPGKMILPGFFIVPTSREGQPILWAANDTLLVSDRDRGFKLTVVKLGVK
ncbi:MAG: PD40 domain-containing protein [Anaerolineae bacterium]|nr:PD40 domain-containing protein [Anaerolineae bacterium]